MVAIAKDVIAAAQASQRKWGVPASISLAQFGVESAWGTKMPSGSFNPFGIKAVSGQPAVIARTREVIAGRSVYINAAFRKFRNFTEAFDQHGQLLGTSRYYAKARATKTPDDYARALNGIYATDPGYGAALIAIMRSANLYQYNKF